MRSANEACVFIFADKPVINPPMFACHGSGHNAFGLSKIWASQWPWYQLLEQAPEPRPGAKTVVSPSCHGGLNDRLMNVWWVIVTKGQSSVCEKCTKQCSRILYGRLSNGGPGTGVDLGIAWSVDGRAFRVRNQRSEQVCNPARQSVSNLFLQNRRRLEYGNSRTTQSTLTLILDRHRQVTRVPTAVRVHTR